MTTLSQSCEKCSRRKWHHRPKRIDAWVCECRRYFCSILILRNRGCSHKHHMGWSSRGVGEREIFKAFKKKTFFSLVCMNVLCSTPCRQESFVLNECSRIWMNVNISQSPCFYCWDQVVCLWRCLRRTICETILSWKMSKHMFTPWISVFSQHGYHVDCFLWFK